MINDWKALLLSMLACLWAGGFLAPPGRTTPPQEPTNEQTIWGLERLYWSDVQEDNLSAYLSLWHTNFLGWPSVNAAPVRKDHITDWITSQTSKGLAFKFLELSPAAIQLTGDVAVACYWIRYKWIDKDGSGSEHTLRITHTWIHTGKKWEIIGGMSMGEPTGAQP